MRKLLILLIEYAWRVLHKLAEIGLYKWRENNYIAHQCDNHSQSASCFGSVWSEMSRERYVQNLLLDVQLTTHHNFPSFFVDGWNRGVIQRVRPNQRAEIRDHGGWDRGGCRVGLG